MKKYIYLLVIFFNVSFVFAQTYSENFDINSNWSGSSGYGNQSYVNSGKPATFSATTTFKENITSKCRSGNRAWRLKKGGSPKWEAKIATGGVGTFSVWVRRWDSSPEVDYLCEYSLDNGSSWTSVVTINNTWLSNSDNYKQISATLNVSNGAGNTDDIIIRIKRNGGERLVIDDFEMTPYANVTCNEPTSDATFHINSPQNITSNSVTLNWTNGDGQKRIVILREANAVSFVPTDTNTYPSNSSFGTGTDIGTNEYVVYNGNSNTVDVTNLTPGTLYYTTIYEYNCNIGSEDYYITGTPTTDYFYTNPENPDNFEPICISDTSIDLSWTAPIGNFDGYLLVVREGAVPHSVNALDPNTALGESTDYTSAATYGSTAPNSRILYKGTSLNTTITGLTQNTNYIFKLFAYSTDGTIYKYSNGTTTSQTIEFQNVINPVAIADDGQVNVSWTNPDNSCYDEILVVANETNGISFSPSGNGSAYTANTNYTAVDQTVFNADGTTVTVTNLTNGTTYYFEIFIRQGTTWSSGIEVNATPNSQTIFEPGDLVIVGYDNKVGSVDDVVTILTMVDVLPNTTFWYANATYEIGALANERTGAWHSCTATPNAAIGAQQFTYLGPDILPAGSTFCMQIDNDQVVASDFTVHQSSGSGTYNFSDGLTPAGFATSLNISTSKPDSIFLMQGSWSGDLGGYRLFNGTVLGGIQDGGDWYTIGDDLSNLSGNDNRRSRIPPEIECFAIQGTTSPGKGFAYYDDTKTGSQITLLGKIGDFNANWVQDVGNNANDIAGHSCDATFIFTISGAATAGVWTNAKNDNNWFNCGNWENLSVPDETTDVVINALSGTDKAIIDDDATDADIFQKIAKCKNLTINGEKLELIGDVDDKLEIHGDLTITNGVLNMDDLDNAIADGTIDILGNWTNTAETNFNEGNSTINFIGTTTQTVSTNSGADTEKFYNLTLDNTNGVSFASNNIHAAGDLHIIHNTTPLTITANHYILAGNALKNDNNTHFIIQHEGSFVQSKNGADLNTGVNNSTFTVHKTTTPYVMYDYTYWSSPLENQALSTVFAANNANYIFSFNTANFSDEHSGNYPQSTGTSDSYDDNGDDWQLESGTMTKGKGYIAMGEGATFPVTPPTLTTSTQSVVFQNGKVNNGLININVVKDLYNTTNGSGNPYNKNDNLLGNPYPSAISASQFLTENTNLGGTIYFWTHDTAISTGIPGPNYYNFTNDDYATWNGSGGTAAHAGSPVPNGNIASGQGFFVTATTAGQVKFDNDMRVVSNNNLFYRPANRVWLDLTNSNGLFRQILIGFFDDATDGEDRLYDGLRLENGTNWDFYSILNGQKMAIQGLSTFSEDKVIPLGVEIIQAGTFEISIAQTEADLNTATIYLKDNLLNITHDLKQSSYQVAINTLGNIDNRFELVFQRDALNVDDNVLASNLIVSNYNENQIKIIANKTISNIKIYDVLGKVLVDVNENNKIVIMDSPVKTAKVLLIQTAFIDGTVTAKKFIKY